MLQCSKSKHKSPGFCHPSSSGHRRRHDRMQKKCHSSKMSSAWHGMARHEGSGKAAGAPNNRTFLPLRCPHPPTLPSPPFPSLLSQPSPSHLPWRQKGPTDVCVSSSCRHLSFTHTHIMYYYHHTTTPPLSTSLHPSAPPSPPLPPFICCPCCPPSPPTIFLLNTSSTTPKFPCFPTTTFSNSPRFKPSSSAFRL